MLVNKLLELLLDPLLLLLELLMDLSLLLLYCSISVLCNVGMALCTAEEMRVQQQCGLPDPDGDLRMMRTSAFCFLRHHICNMH